MTVENENEFAIVRAGFGDKILV